MWGGRSVGRSIYYYYCISHTVDESRARWSAAAASSGPAQAFAPGGLVTSTPTEDACTRIPCRRDPWARVRLALRRLAISVGPAQLFGPGVHAAGARFSPNGIFRDRAFSTAAYPTLVGGFRKENPESPKFGFALQTAPPPPPSVRPRYCPSIVVCPSKRGRQPR